MRRKRNPSRVREKRDMRGEENKRREGAEEREDKTEQEMGSKGIKRGGERSCTSLHDENFFPVARDMQRGRRGKKIERGEEEKKEKRGGEEEENLLLPLRAHACMGEGKKRRGRVSHMRERKKEEIMRDRKL